MGIGINDVAARGARLLAQQGEGRRSWGYGTVTVAPSGGRMSVAMDDGMAGAAVTVADCRTGAVVGNRVVVLMGDGAWSAIAVVGTQPSVVAPPNAVTLYSNAAGSNGNVTLSETAANFAKLEIQYRTHLSPNPGAKCVSVLGPNGKDVILDAVVNNNGIYHIGRMVAISGTSVTTVAARTGMSAIGLASPYSPSANSNTNIYITDIIGYRTLG